MTRWNKQSDIHFIDMKINIFKNYLTINYALDKLIYVSEVPSSRGLGHIPFTDATGVQIPLGLPFLEPVWLFFIALIHRKIL